LNTVLTYSKAKDEKIKELENKLFLLEFLVKNLEAEIQSLKKGMSGDNLHHAQAIKTLENNNRKYLKQENELVLMRAEVDRLTHLHSLDHSLANQWEFKNQELKALLGECEEALSKAIPCWGDESKHDDLIKKLKDRVKP